MTEYSYQEYYKKKNDILCANCGGIGHIYKSCNHPVISYGIICYQLHYDTETNSVYPKYLMVQRKDSLSYVEFIRGKYDIKNKTYLLKLFSFMTVKERTKIQENTFETLWMDMWCKHIDQENNKNFSKEYNEANQKFSLLKRGIHIKTQENIVLINFDYIFANSSSVYTDTEWGFPKGRRNINEDDVSCAVREFREETGISPMNIRLCADIKPCEEIFSGTNKIRYKHVYYIAKYYEFSEDNLFDPENKQQCKEIKDVQWFSYTDAQCRIRDQNVERKELLKRINSIIMKQATC